MLRSLCGCLAKISDKVADLADDGGEKKKIVTDKGDGLEDLLKRNLLTIRGRRRLIKDISFEQEPTKFDDDDDPPSEDEDGEETAVMQNGVFGNQDFARLQSKCQETEQLFVDPLFPPCRPSISLDGSGAEGIEWKRPSEICDDPEFLVEGGSRFDVKQGELGDCWLLAAIANLTLHKKLFEQVVPHDQSFSDNYSGIFHFRFWQYGNWIDVVIDDLLPTRDGRLIYMRSETKNEFWSALLEKAYAKLHGSYSALRGGTTCEAMVDFSGGCSEQFELKRPPQDVFNIMFKGYVRASMMACSVEPDRYIFEAKTSSGLVKGHAYSLTKVLKAKVDTGRKTGLYPLIRIRNPWGNDTEWKGAWSDGSREWQYVPDSEKETLGLTFDGDGEFFMSERDFLRQFDTLEICNLSPESLDEEELNSGKVAWHEKRFNGSWIAGKTAGGCRNFLDTFATNPQFRVVLTDSDEDDDEFCTCLISLMQKGSRKRKAIHGQGALTIGFAIYRLDDPDNTEFPLTTDFFKYHLSTAKPKAFVNLRELSARFKLLPGTYVIIPSTFEPNEEADFLLRVFSEADSSVDCLNDAGDE